MKVNLMTHYYIRENFSTFETFYIKIALVLSPFKRNLAALAKLAMQYIHFCNMYLEHF